MSHLTEVRAVTCSSPKTRALKALHTPAAVACTVTDESGLLKSCKTIYYWFSLTIDIKPKPRSVVAHDGLLLMFSWAAVLSTVWGWSQIDGKHSCVLVKRHTLTSVDLLSIFVPCERPVWTAVHLTAQLHILIGEHVQPRCPVLHFWRRNF